MFTPIFKLKEPSKDGPTSIRFYFYLNKRRFVYSLGSEQRIHPELWDTVRMRPISKSAKVCTDESERNHNKYLLKKWKDENAHIESDLRNIDTRISNIITVSRKYISNKEDQSENIDFDELKNRLDQTFDIVRKSPEKVIKTTLNEYIVQLVTDIQNGKETFTNNKNEIRRYSDGTAKTYKEWQERWNEFQEAKRKKFDFKDITVDFYKVYVSYWSKRGYTTNTIGKQVKTLKAIMRRAEDQGLHKNSHYRQRAFKTLHTETTEVYLTADELQRMYALDLSKKPNYDLARDVFLAGCWTAMRFSDYSRISPEHIKSDQGSKYIDMITRKTGERVIIPIRPELDQILKKYKNHFPKTHEQKVNKYIKEVAILAKIDGLVQVEKVVKGMTVSKNIPKNEMIKTHTARRTGCSLMYLAGIPTIDICKISGHRSEKNLLKYIRVSKDETAKRLSMNSFFKGTDSRRRSI